MTLDQLYLFVIVTIGFIMGLLTAFTVVLYLYDRHQERQRDRRWQA